jgi:Transglutaminase-like superfamily
MELLFFKALSGLLAFDLFGLNRDFARLYRTVRGWPTADRIARADIVERVCSAVNHACSWYPKRAMCLQRSVVTTCLLRKCGVPAHMVLGAQNLPFKAHAWVEVDGRPVNETNDVQAIYGVWDHC